MVQKIKLLIILFLLGTTSYFILYKVPKLEKEIASFTYLEPEIRYLPGRVDTVKTIDTLWRDPIVVSVPEEKEPEDSVRVFETAFQDSLLEGKVHSRIGLTGQLYSQQVYYRFKKPIYSTSRVDTVKITQTIEKRVDVPAPRNFRVQLGMGANYGPQGIGLGPKIQVLTKGDAAIFYSYDVFNSVHWVGYTRTIRLW